MFPSFPSLFFHLVLLLAEPAHLTASTSQELEVRGHRTPRDAKQESIKVVISEGCATQGGDSDGSQGDKEIDLTPGSPLVLTHKIKLVPSGSGSGSGSCGCETDFAALRERLERLEREVSALREKCGGAEGGCCTSKESKGSGCSIKPGVDECPNECSDQGRCVDGKCVCFSGFSGPDCSDSNCPGNCNNNGRCVNGQCVCDPGFAGPDCLQRGCPDNCNDRGRCVNGKCVCDSGYTGPSCSDEACPGNCNNRGRCVNGQCVCNPGFAGPDCSRRGCPDNCNNRGRCVNGKCVCEGGYTGDSCSEVSCPGNCNNRGRCVDGECVCDEGFTGDDCTEKICPNDCYDRGRCVDGVCECESGFTGEDCSEVACPGNCNNRGRCVNGQCVCDEGFTGPDCLQKSCPNNCSNRGRCVNGKCVCDAGFAGPDCASKGCPANCNNKGRCVKGRCVCRRGFTGPDCSQCEEGMTGPNCDTAMTGVSQLSTQEITETSVTLVWTPPAVQYETYHITFTSQKEIDQQITVQVEGSLTTFTQTGLAAGQEYTATVTGEIGGRRGAESSAEFMTLLSGPSNLRVVKTTTTSAVVQWERSQGEIDRYRLTVSPRDGVGRSQEMTFAPDRDSAHIQELEAGRVYDVTLVAEKGESRSEPATTEAVPGNALPNVSTAAVSMQVVPSQGQDVGARDQSLSPSPERQGVDRQGKTEDGHVVDSVRDGSITRPSKGSSATVVAKTKPLVSRKDGTKPKLAERPVLLKKPNAQTVFRGNGTRIVPGARKVDPKVLKKFPAGVKTKLPTLAKKPKPGAPSKGDRMIAPTVRDPSAEAPSIESRDENSPAIMPGSHSETIRQGSSEEPALRPEQQPDVGTEVQGRDIDPPPPQPTAAGHSSEKKCMNKIKVTHIRLPHKDKGSGCRGDGTVPLGKTTSPPHQGSSETDDAPLKHDLEQPPAETDVSRLEDSLYKYLTDTANSLNITTFSIHLSKPVDLSSDAETVRKEILGGLKPLSFSPYTSEALPRQSKPEDESSESSSSMELTSLITSSSIPTLAPSTSSPSPMASSLLPRKSASSSSSSSEVSDSDERDPSKVDTGKGISHSTSPEETKPPPREGAGPVFRRTPPKGGHIRLRPNTGPFRNRTHLNVKAPYRLNVPLNHPSKETEGSHNSTRVLSSPTSSLSAEADVNASTDDMGADKDGASTVKSPGDEQNRKKIIMQRGKHPIRRLPPSGGSLRRPLLNKGPFQNRTRPNLSFQISQSRHSKHETATQEEHIPTTALPTRESPVSAESYPDEGTQLVGENTDGNAGESVSSDISKTRDSRPPSSPLLNSNVRHSGQPNLHVAPFYIRNRTNLRPPQAPRRVPNRFPSPIRKPGGVLDVTVEGKTGQSERDNTPDIPDTRPGGQGSYHDTQVVQSTPSGEAIQTVRIPDSNVPPQSNQLENGESVQTSREKAPDTPDSNSGDDQEHIDAGRNTGPSIRGRPFGKPTDLRPRPSRPAAPPKKQPPGRRITAESPTRVINLSGSQRGADPPTNYTVKMDPSRASISLTESDAAREPLDYVRVTNRTSDGFAVTWDAPEGKYKNFIVTRKEVGKDEEPKERESRQKLESNQDESEKHSVQDKEEVNRQPIKGDTGDENKVPESDVTQVSSTQSNTEARPQTESDKTFKKVLPGSARSFQFEDLPPQTEYTVTLLGKGPGLLSRLHKLVISTGPEPPTDIVFSEVTENSLTVSWTKPKSPVSGFKVTYTHTEEGEPVSVSVDSADSTLGLSRLTPGSTYEVSVISILGLDESDPAKDLAMTLPDPPTDLRAINVTDTKALLLWRPALATVDKYAIVYGSGKDSDLRITVSGNAAEQQLSGLEGSTTYTVTISSLLGSLESSPATTTFTTTSGSKGDGDGPRDLQASNVSPRTALLSWKPPSNPVGSYRLTYQTEGQEMKEVIVGATVTEYNLTRLHPGAMYSVQLQAERGGIYTSAISTEFTTGTLRFPFPSDCSQELLNGIRTSGEVEIFPLGKDGTPMMVYCDMETDGGGWTVFQRRKDGSVDFFRGWKDYIKGFGDLSGEFWLGLDSLHNLTAMTRMSLRVDLRDSGESVFAKYSTFEVARRNYKLTVGGYSGTAGDSLSYHNNRVFSTKDRDPAPFITRCAMSYRGGWWYKNCHEANLNGLYGIDVKHQGIIWTTWKGKETSIAFTEMKMRPAAFYPPARG